MHNIVRRVDNGNVRNASGSYRPNAELWGRTLCRDGGLHDGRTSICLRLCSSPSTQPVAIPASAWWGPRSQLSSLTWTGSKNSDAAGRKCLQRIGQHFRRTSRRATNCH